MAFQPRDLSVLAYANNFTMWHYTTEDASVTTADYFNDAKDMLRVNDLIISNVDTDGTPVSVFYIVTGNDGVDVTVTAYS
ncbi:MAG: hypothetical protein CL565_05340 [Alphaproteobacteria bacterium]|nr:hypothetical protein [Alphaproteobacteria bacterium]|tara:strand:- start:144 stop:383 length:240 start_codon:yes stop_codon:yes gene_type:complete